MTAVADGGKLSEHILCLWNASLSDFYQSDQFYVGQLPLTGLVTCGLVAHFLHLSGGKIKISGSGCEQKKNGHLSGCIWQEYKY